MRFFRGLLFGSLFSSILWAIIFLAFNAFAQDYYASEDIATLETKRIRNIGCVHISLESKTVTIDTQWNYVDTDNNILRTEPGDIILLQNIADDPETVDIDETDNQFNDLMQALGLTKSKIISEVKAILQ